MSTKESENKNQSNSARVKPRRYWQVPIRVPAKVTSESLTQQQFADECDINKIMRKYKQTGVISHVSRIQGVYGDFTHVEEYQQMLEKVQLAENSFNSLPAEIRDRFGNDPKKLVMFLSDPKNQQEAERLGLSERKNVTTTKNDDDAIKAPNKPLETPKTVPNRQDDTKSS